MKGLRKHQGQALSYDNIRQLFQNILDLVFIVEHTYQGKVLRTHTTTNHFWEKSCKKNKTATALVMQSQLEEFTLAKEFWPLGGAT